MATFLQHNLNPRGHKIYNFSKSSVVGLIYAQEYAKDFKVIMLFSFMTSMDTPYHNNPCPIGH